MFALSPITWVLILFNWGKMCLSSKNPNTNPDLSDSTAFNFNSIEKLSLFVSHYYKSVQSLYVFL